MAYIYEYLYKIDQLGVSDYTLKITDDSDASKVVFIPVIVSKSEDNKENLDKIALNIISVLQNEEAQQLELIRQKLEKEELERMISEQQVEVVDSVIIETKEITTEDTITLTVEEPQEINL